MAAEFEANREKYAQEFDEEQFERKTARGGFGRSVLRKLYTLYEVLRDEDTPAWVKLGIVCVLGYFVCPIDAIPDMLPLVGYGDDMAIVAAELASIASYVTPSVRRRVEDRLN